MESVALVFFLFEQSLGQLELFSYPPTNASYCPGNVTFTCVGQDVSIGLNWLINGIIVENYVFTNFPDEIFPHVIFSNHYRITVTNASQTSPVSHNVVSTLQGDVSFLLNDTVSCNVLNAWTVPYFIKIRDSPPPPRKLSCSMPSNNEVAIQWTVLSNDTEVMLNVVMQSPFTNVSCSGTHSIYPYQNISCQGVREDSLYYFNVFSINCESQKTGPFMYQLHMYRSLSTIFDTKVWSSDTIHLVLEIHWNHQDLSRSNLVNKFNQLEGTSVVIPTALLQVVIQDNFGRIHSKFSFSQHSDEFCSSTTMECVIVKPLRLIGQTISKLQLNITAFNEEMCGGLLNSYIERIPTDPVNFTIAVKDNTILVACSPAVDNSTCFLQYQIPTHNRNFSSRILLDNNEFSQLQIGLPLNEPCYIKITLVLSPTLQIMAHFVYYINEKLKFVYHEISTPAISVFTHEPIPSNMTNMHWIVTVSVMSVVIFVGCLITSILIMALCYKVKLLTKENHQREFKRHGNTARCRDGQRTKVSEIIYDEPYDRMSIHSEVIKNDQYCRYEKHKLDDIKTENQEIPVYDNL